MRRILDEVGLLVYLALACAFVWGLLYALWGRRFRGEK